MKIHLLSDLHNEFTPFEPSMKAVNACDVVVLAGDIDVGVRGIAWAREVFGTKPIVYVAGNHEFYGHHWTHLLDDLREEAKRLNVFFLENDSVEIDGVRFFGCTLWTDFKFFPMRSQTGVMRACQKGMREFREIRAARRLAPDDGSPAPQQIDAGRRLTARHVVARHEASIAWLRERLFHMNAQGCRPVVVTHHLPSARSVEPALVSRDLAASYASNLDDLIPSAGIWLHGHAHASSDYLVCAHGREGRVVCNPRGYDEPAKKMQEHLNPRFDRSLVLQV